MKCQAGHKRIYDSCSNEATWINGWPDWHDRHEKKHYIIVCSECLAENNLGRRNWMPMDWDEAKPMIELWRRQMAREIHKRLQST